MRLFVHTFLRIFQKQKLQQFWKIFKKKRNSKNSKKIFWKNSKNFKKKWKKILTLLSAEAESTDTKVKLYQNEDIGLMLERWAKLQRDFRHPRTGIFDVSKIPDLYDSIKYDAQHNPNLKIPIMDELYETSKTIADIVIPQEYGITKEEKLNISHGYCVPLLRKILADLQANIDNPDEPGNRLNPLFSKAEL